MNLCMSMVPIFLLVTLNFGDKERGIDWVCLDRTMKNGGSYMHGK